MAMLRSASFWCGLALWALFFPIAAYLERQELFGLLDSLIVSVGCGVMVAYGKAAADKISVPLTKHRSGDAIILSIFIGALGITAAFGMLWFWRLSGKTSGIIDSLAAAFPRWVIMTSGMLALAASGAIDGKVPLRSYVKAGIWVALGVALFLAIVAGVVRG